MASRRSSSPRSFRPEDPILVSRSGGVAGLRLEWEIPASALGRRGQRQLAQGFKRTTGSRPLNPATRSREPARDLIRYRFALGGRKSSPALVFDDFTLPRALKAVVQRLARRIPSNDREKGLA